MKCLHLNIRGAIFLTITVFLHGVKHSEMAGNDYHKDPSNKDMIQKTSINSDLAISVGSDTVLECPTGMNCNEMQYPCISCHLNSECIYGEELNTSCSVISEVICKGKKQFVRTSICRYCYQTDPWEHTCTLKANCNSVATPKQYYRTNCSVRNDIICLGFDIECLVISIMPSAVSILYICYYYLQGNRNFLKKVLCNWTGGYRWSTAIALSITLGGFGADRFYLGHWQEGIGKLFSFGGLGVWTLIDVILISLHYLGPADGSLYL